MKITPTTTTLLMSSLSSIILFVVAIMLALKGNTTISMFIGIAMALDGASGIMEKKQ